MKSILAATATLLLAACASQPSGPVLTAAEHCARMGQAIPAAAIAPANPVMTQANIRSSRKAVPRCLGTSPRVS